MNELQTSVCIMAVHRKSLPQGFLVFQLDGGTWGRAYLSNFRLRSVIVKGLWKQLKNAKRQISRTRTSLRNVHFITFFLPKPLLKLSPTSAPN